MKKRQQRQSHRRAPSTTETIDEGESSLHDDNDNDNGYRQDSSINVAADNVQSEYGRHYLPSLRRRARQNDEVGGDEEGQHHEARTTSQSHQYNVHSSKTTITRLMNRSSIGGGGGGVDDGSSFNEFHHEYPSTFPTKRHLRNQHESKIISNTHHHNMSKPNRLPPGAPGQISSSCLLIPVFIAVWWYWTRKVHSIFVVISLKF